jgi:O-acetyl-ADP-ribose deacetylase (regulator of RNase III)
MKVLKPFSPTVPAEALRVSFCDTNPAMAEAWLKFFADVGGVEIVEGDLLKLHSDALVAPGNSFGDMDGGLDKAIDDFFGRQAQPRVKEQLAAQHFGELPVGAASVIPMSDRRFPFLIYAPTMRVPSNVAGTVNAYLAMRAALIAVLQFAGPEGRTIRSVAVPGLCTGIGQMPYRTAAEQMRAAYDNIVGGGWKQVVYSALAPFAVPGWTFKPV